MKSQKQTFNVIKITKKLQIFEKQISTTSITKGVIGL